MEAKKKVLFVVDGGLSNNLWREQFKKDRKHYEELAYNDESNPQVVEALKACRKEGYEIVIAASRLQKNRDPLINWLVRHCELRPGEYKLVEIDGINYYKNFVAIYTPDESQCSQWMTISDPSCQIFHVKADGKIEDYRKRRALQDKEYARLKNNAEVKISVDAPEVTIGLAEATIESPEVTIGSPGVTGHPVPPEDMEIEQEGIGQEDTKPSAFRSHVGNLVVVVYTKSDESETASEITKVLRRLIREGYPIAVISRDQHAYQEQVTAKVREMLPEIQSGQLFLAFKDVMMSDESHVVKALIDIDSMTRANGGKVAAYLTNDERTAALCDSILGAGIAARNDDELDRMWRSLVEIAKQARGEEDGKIGDEDQKSGIFGGRVNYYLVRVDHPQREEQPPYQAECEDIISALKMDFNEACEFKEIWRTAAARLGNGKPGHTSLYGAQKRVHYATRSLREEERKNSLQAKAD